MFNTSHLMALAAVCETGSFEAAARSLHVTASAVSQRINALEAAAGHALVQRTRPVTPTAAGRVLFALARQIGLLMDDADAQLHGRDSSGSGATRFSLAINVDSVSTWFRPAFAAMARERRILLDLYIEDQDHTVSLLREGLAMAAVTTFGDPVPGCSAEPLGYMRYLPVCSPALLSGEPATAADPSRLPMVRFGLKDDLHQNYLRLIGARREPPTHYIPSNPEFFAAVKLGLGWGILPETQVADDVEAGRLVLLDRDRTLSVPLFWQRWRLESTTLDHVSEIVRTAAGAGLRRGTPGSGESVISPSR